MTVVEFSDFPNIHQSDCIITLFLLLYNFSTIYGLYFEEVQFVRLFESGSIYETQYIVVSDSIEPNNQLFLIFWITNDDELMIGIQQLSQHLGYTRVHVYSISVLDVSIINHLFFGSAVNNPNLTVILELINGIIHIHVIIDGFDNVIELLVAFQILIHIIGKPIGWFRNASTQLFDEFFFVQIRLHCIIGLHLFG